MNNNDDPLVYQPDPDDFSFTFRNIVKGYANIGLLLRDKAKIQDAMQCYATICGNQAAAETFQPENTAAQLKSVIPRLQRAARYWQKEPEHADFQRDYANLVRMAYDDVAGPLAVIDEATNVLKKHMNESSSAESTMGVATGLSFDDLQHAYKTLDRMRSYLKGFSEPMRDIATLGNMGVGGSDDSLVDKQFLGRHVAKREKNSDRDTELLFYGIVGILSAEKETILQELAKVQPANEAESLRASFEAVTRRISEYAKFAIDDPKRAVSLLQADIPECLKAFTVVKEKLNSDEFSVIDSLLHCIRSLQLSGPNKDGTSASQL